MDILSLFFIFFLVNDLISVDFFLIEDRIAIEIQGH